MKFVIRLSSCSTRSSRAHNLRCARQAPSRKRAVCSQWKELTPVCCSIKVVNCWTRFSTSSTKPTAELCRRDSALSATRTIIVRPVSLSGPQSLGILRQLVRSQTFDPQPNMLTLHSLFASNSDEVLDQGMVCYFKAPHSFTGEDVVELHCHGSPILLRGIVDAALRLNARMADPGEFSLRAVSNGRINLSEAEAIRDLIEAHTDAGLKQATRQLKGEVSNILQPLKDDLLKVIVRLESSLEFVEDDLPAVEQGEIIASLRAVRCECDRLSETFSRGLLLRDGLRVTLLGRPNTGKSSIFNR